MGGPAFRGSFVSSLQRQQFADHVLVFKLMPVSYGQASSGDVLSGPRQNVKHIKENR